MHRVGPHVGDEPPFVQPLSAAHGFPRRQAQLAVGFLLEGAGGERRYGTTHRRFLLHRLHPPIGTAHLISQCAGVILTEESDGTALLQGTRGLIKIMTGGNLLPPQMTELGFKGAAGMAELCLQIPVTAAAEGPTGTLPLHQQAHSD